MKGFEAEATVHAVSNKHGMHRNKAKPKSVRKTSKPEPNDTKFNKKVETKMCLFCAKTHKMLKSECPAFPLVTNEMRMRCISDR